MVDAGPGDGLGEVLSQLLQRVVGVVEAELCELPQLRRQGLEAPALFDVPDSFDLPVGSIESPGGVGVLKVHAAVDPVAHILVHFGAHELQRGLGGAHEGQKVLHALAVLEVDDMEAAPLDIFRREAGLLHELHEVCAEALRGEDIFEVVVLLRVGDGAGCQEGAAQQGGKAAFVLKDVAAQPAVDLVAAVAELREDGLPVDGVLHRYAVLAAGGPLQGGAVAGHFPDRVPVGVGNGFVLGLDAHFLQAEGTAEQEERIGLGLPAAGLHFTRLPGSGGIRHQFRFHVAGKGQDRSPLFLLDISVGGVAADVLFPQVAGHGLRKGDRAVFSAGAAEREDELALPLLLIQRQGEVDEVLELCEELLRGLELHDIAADGLIEAGQVLEFGNVEGVRQAADVEDEVGIRRQAVLEPKGHALDLQDLFPAAEEEAGNAVLQLFRRQIGGVDGVVRPLFEGGDHLPFRRNGVADGLVVVPGQRVPAAGLLEPVHEDAVLAVHEKQLVGHRHAAQLVEGAGEVFEGGPGAHVDDHRELRLGRALQDDLSEGREEFGRHVVDADEVDVFQHFHRFGFAGTGQAGEDYEFHGVSPSMRTSGSRVTPWSF